MNSSDQAAFRKAPLPPTTVTVGTGSTTAITLTADPTDTFHEFQADGGKIYYRFGASKSMGAATLNDWHIPDGDKEPYVITDNRKYVRFIAESSGIKVRYGEVN